MSNRILFFISLISLLIGCTNQDFLEVSQSPIEGNWEKTDFWIDDTSIVFEATYVFNANNTFHLQAKVLHKLNTTYTPLNLMGEWTYSEIDNTLTLDYINQEKGLIAYYLDEPITSEVYFVQIDNNTMRLKNKVGNKIFEFVLINKH